MKKIFLAAALCALLVTPALAHPDHVAPRPIAKQDHVRSRATAIVDTMIERKAVEPSWKGLAPAKTELRTRAGVTEWVVTFNNGRVTDTSKRVLYVMLNPYGEFVAANHTGN